MRQVATAGALLLASATTMPLHAQLQAGDFFVSEPTAGTIVNVAGGGDFTGAPRFASGLTEPLGLCQGPGGDLYVAELTPGTVTIATAGGDLSATTPLATGLSNPVELSCNPSQILVIEFDSGAGTGRVVDITAGGDFSNAQGFAFDLAGGLGLGEDQGGTLYASTVDGDLFDITAGGSQMNATPFATDSSLNGLSPPYVASYSGDAVYDFSGGGTLTSPFAQVDQASNVIAADGSIYASSELDDAIYDITAGGDFTTGATPFASGLAIGAAGGFTGMVYVEAFCGDGTVSPGEECDDMGESASCDDDCTAATCGDGTLNAAAGEECDDMGESASCDTDCTAATCGDGTLNTTAGEQCDDGNTTAGDGCGSDCQSDDGGVGGAGMGGAGADGSGAGDDVFDAGSEERPVDSAGCGCRLAARPSTGAGSWLGLWLAGTIVRRRRRR